MIKDVSEGYEGARRLFHIAACCSNRRCQYMVTSIAGDSIGGMKLPTRLAAGEDSGGGVPWRCPRRTITARSSRKPAFVEKLLFLFSHRAAENRVAMGEAPEASHDVAVPLGIGKVGLPEVAAERH